MDTYFLYIPSTQDIVICSWVWLEKTCLSGNGSIRLCFMYFLSISASFRVIPIRRIFLPLPVIVTDALSPSTLRSFTFRSQTSCALVPVAYRADDYFFMSRWGDRHYSINTISSYFRGILFRCGIHHGGRKNGGPHLHCLRHTFCCHSLEKMLREGTAHQAALPFLMTYLGHSSLSATGYYLRLTAEAFPDLQDKINRLY
mgnify:FL=1